MARHETQRHAWVVSSVLVGTKGVGVGKGLGAFEEFVVGRGPSLLRFAYLLSGDGGLAEDLVQDALVRAHRRWDRVVCAEHPEAYVRRIVLREFLSWRRRKSSSEVPGLVPDVIQPDAAEALVERDMLWRALAELPRRQRAVLVLRYYQDLPDAEIALTLECAEGTVRSLAARAFEALRHDPQLVNRTWCQLARDEEER